MAELKTTLGRLNGREPVRVRIDYQSSDPNGEAAAAPAGDGRAAAFIEDGSDGLRVSCGRDVIERAAAEDREHERNPEQKTATSRALNELNATQLAGYLNAAQDLLDRLQNAELTDEKADTWDGQPARLLTFKITPRLDARSRKLIKEIDASARVWIGADGVPFAAETRCRLKGRALLVITFDSAATEEFRFQRTGNRLVVVRHVKETSGSGGGQSNHQKTVASLSIVDDRAGAPAGG